MAGQSEDSQTGDYLNTNEKRTHLMIQYRVAKGREAARPHHDKCFCFNENRASFQSHCTFGACARFAWRTRKRLGCSVIHKKKRSNRNVSIRATVRRPLAAVASSDKTGGTVAPNFVHAPRK